MSPPRRHVEDRADHCFAGKNGKPSFVSARRVAKSGHLIQYKRLLETLLRAYFDLKSAGGGLIDE